ncbi:tRNA (N6-threonylcarbamoyladenosine(37)-N6)-methyltransferase TrmO [Xylanibacter muris]|uniref:tRNA (N6-threonylcarbamoyladenosine(37)-N6)-methyltransferase TrmO n=1 Tax=Xylanibacter muris TaxID=2736290 RepID=A0ABX2AJ20_9BACT|nr:tRNA (N6-threonylcarbamoyladenosine(37)-N6)-methyltransferase TrmO [Xylanibacter muris]NPD91096.1 tRNA (N6-threonylcarbamoyladenosine(37)-N6)-methyltransferase TrmO [Xylanibacter muris]
MEIEPIAHFKSPLTSKFGIPRQSGIVSGLRGQIVFEPRFRNAEALRGMEGFDYLWLIWGFSCNVDAAKHPTVRPPRLGGNEHMGVFATRSSFRPNNLGLSSVTVIHIDYNSADGPVIHVGGADLMDGTPIYDIKPYVEFTDSHPNVRSGFADEVGWQSLSVCLSESIVNEFTPDERNTLKQILSQDPRPHYHRDSRRIYGMPFAGRDIKFTVENGTVKAFI